MKVCAPSVYRPPQLPACPAAPACSEGPSECGGTGSAASAAETLTPQPPGHQKGQPRHCLNPIGLRAVCMFVWMQARVFAAPLPPLPLGHWGGRQGCP
eukprot:477995-Pelagomonas_calceolata.AAC.3